MNPAQEGRFSYNVLLLIDLPSGGPVASLSEFAVIVMNPPACLGKHNVFWH